MHAGLLESYQPRRSPMHRLSAAVKLFVAIGLVLGLVALPRGWSGAAFCAVCCGMTVGLWTVAALTRLPAGFLLRRLLLLEPFALGVGRMQRARASRTFAARSRWSVWRSLAEMLGQLFVRAVERASRIYAAMCARGWEGNAEVRMQNAKVRS